MSKLHNLIHSFTKMSVTVTGVETIEDNESLSDVEVGAGVIEDPDCTPTESFEEGALSVTETDIQHQQQKLELRYARSELSNLMKEARRKGFWAKIKAEICRVVNVIFLVLIGVSQAGIFTVASYYHQKEDLPVMVISGIGTAITIVYGVIGPGSRGSYYKQISVRLRGMYRTARESLVKMNNSEDMIDLVNMNMAEMDKMDLNIYAMGMGNTSAIPGADG